MDCVCLHAVGCGVGWRGRNDGGRGRKKERFREPVKLWTPSMALTRLGVSSVAAVAETVSKLGLFRTECRIVCETICTCIIEWMTIFAFVLCIISHICTIRNRSNKTKNVMRDELICFLVDTKESLGRRQDESERIEGEKKTGTAHPCQKRIKCYRLKKVQQFHLHNSKNRR